jgi:hypothetical protein
MQAASKANKGIQVIRTKQCRVKIKEQGESLTIVESTLYLEK